MLKSWLFDRSLKALRKSEHEVVSAYGAADWPDPDMPATGAPYCALDFELDGLSENADILQAGWSPFEGTSMRLDEARSRDVRSKARLDEVAVTIHGIGEQRAAAGLQLEDVLAQLLPALAGRVIVAHAAGIERSAIRRMVEAAYGADLPVRAVCTLTLERQLHPNLMGGSPYRLGAARKRYGLPDYPPHDALTDAIAAAELFQAQLTRLPRETRLRDIEV